MEYVIIKDDRVIWGPRPWNPFAIEATIEREARAGVTIGANPVVGKIVETPAVIAILKVEQSIIPSHDIIFETLVGPQWTHNVVSGTTTMAYDVADQHLPYVQGSLKTHATNIRKTKEDAGVVVNVANTDIKFASDRTSRERLILQSLLAQNVNWKTDDGFVELSTADQLKIVQALNAHVQQAYNWEMEIARQIDAAKTIQELKQIHTAMQE